MLLLRDTSQSPSENLGPAVVESIWIEMGIATMILGMRFYTRARVVGKVAFDDWLMLFAYVSVDGASTINRSR